MKSGYKKFNKTLCGIASAVLALGTVSCGDMLDLKPQGVLFADQIGEDQAIELMTAAYACLANNLRPGDNDQSFNGPTTNWVIDLRSDDALKGGPDAGNQGHMLQLEIGNIQSDNACVSMKWANDYFAVARCNIAIQTLMEAGNIAETVRNSYIAEMKLLRAYFYFDILRLYKKFPYIDETMNASEVPAGNKTRREVAELIKQDLRNAYQLLPESQELKGRFNKYVAAALLAKVDLFTATSEFTDNPLQAFAEAEQYCDYVISSGQYDLFPYFQDLSDPTLNNGSESVMAIQFSSANEGQMFNFNNCLNCTYSEGNIYGNGDDFYLGSQDLANAFRTNNDGLPYIDGVTSAYTGNDIMGRLDGVEELYPIYSGNTDPRMDLTLGRIGMYWRSNLAVPSQTYIYNKEWCRNYDLFGQFSGKKPYPAPYNPDVTVGVVPWGASTLNFMLIRYADVLLMKAEALVEQNKEINEAIALVNRVRQRAADSLDPNISAPTDLNPSLVAYNIGLYTGAYTQQAARLIVRTERRLELAMEGNRWFDLLRWGNAKEVIDKYYQYEAQFQEYYNSASLSVEDFYFPIPQSQVDNSNGLYSN